MFNHSEKVSFIWSVADLIRDTFKRSKYQDVILPFTVLRRIDCVLEPTHEDVLQTYNQYKGKLKDLDDLLVRKAGYAFYNTSPYDFQKLVADADNIAANLKAYIGGFSENMRGVLEKFDLYNTIDKLSDAGLLFLVVEKFSKMELHPDQVSNLEMGYIFEELIRKFNEATNENPGEHFTPREVIQLMVEVSLGQDDERLRQSNEPIWVYDPCCGTGGMLTEAQEHIRQIKDTSDVRLYGQEVNPETFAVCKSDLFMKSSDGADAEYIAYGSTLSDDAHANKRFDYMLANPPYGKDWKADRKAIEAEAKRGHAGRFGAGTPRINDGQMLFLQHMLNRMRTVADGGSRIADITNGSPLFTGDAGSGETEIRRWILENDWLEAIIALPEQLFYNTGIATYVWVLSNRKSPQRRGKVQLIDATGKDFWVSMRKSLGDKRREMTDTKIQKILEIYEAFEESDFCKIYPTTHFGYRKVTIERPLRVNFQASPERIDRLYDETKFQNLAKSKKKKKDVKDAEEAEGRELQQQIIAMLQSLPDTLYTSRKAFRKDLVAAVKKNGIKLRKAEYEAIESALGEVDETAEICHGKDGRPEANGNLRDYEYIPLTDDIDDYFQREVLPHVPDAWIDTDTVDEKDGKVGKVGYEINFNRYFYQYELPRPLHEIEADLKDLERDILAMLRDVAGGIE